MPSMISTLHRALSAAALTAAMLVAGCATLPAPTATRLAFECYHADGDRAGNAYFDPISGEAVFVFTLGISLKARMVEADGATLRAQVKVGASTATFQIPRDGGESVVEIQRAEEELDEGESAVKRKPGRCAKIIAPVESLSDVADAPLAEARAKRLP